MAAAIHLLLSSGVGPLNYHVSVRRAPSGNKFVNIGPEADSKMFVAKDAAPVPENERRELEEKFDHTYLSIRYTSVLAYMVLSWMLYRKRQPLVVSHLVAGLHFYSFWYLLAAAVSQIAKYGAVWARLGLLSSIYLFFSLRRLYQQGVFATLWKTAVIFSGSIVFELLLAFLAATWAENH